MENPRTKLDVIFHDLLGEVGDVLDRQARLQAALDKVGAEVAERIGLQAVNLQQTIDSTGPQIGKHIVRSLAAHLESSKKDVERAAVASVTSAAETSAKASAEAVGRAVTDAAIRLEAAATAAVKAAHRPGVLLLVAAISAAIGALVATTVVVALEGWTLPGRTALGSSSEVQPTRGPGG